MNNIHQHVYHIGLLMLRKYAKIVYIKKYVQSESPSGPQNPQDWTENGQREKWSSQSGEAFPENQKIVTLSTKTFCINLLQQVF